MNELLAKSRGGARAPLGLVQHTEDVIDVTQWMFGTERAPTRLGSCWLRFFKLEPAQAADYFACLPAAAAFHDWGKANDSFQDAIVVGKQQLIRHEHLSALMLACDSSDSWLQSNGALHRNRDVVLSVVATHHLKLRDMESFAQPLCEGKIFRILCDRPDFSDLLELIERRLSLTGPRPTFQPFWSFESAPHTFSVEPLRQQVGKRLKQLGRELKTKPTLRRLTMALRAALIAADAAASGLFRVGHDRQSFIRHVFSENSLCDENYITREIIAKRIEQLRQAHKWRNWNEFQNQAELLEDRALLTEPCGSGKTLAAWRWIASRLRSGREVARVIFLYPTRATTTEGFRDYVSWAPEGDAGLLHGTAEYDLAGMFENPADDRSSKRFETDERLFAVGFWTKRIFAATVDQFLAFLQYAYGPVCLLPMLADSVVVIDEVHSFDQAMFSALKCFLREFDVPVLCMSATVPAERRHALKNLCELKPPTQERPPDLQQIADAPRYRLRRISKEDVNDIVCRAVASGKRVLWVVNQVKRAQEAVGSVASRGDWPRDGAILCYHSRFRLCDRRDRHSEVVAAFQQKERPALALTTQVCEMSLDLDADLLVTEECPITSMIQRSGRCNRSRDVRALSGEILVYKPDDELPYDRESLGGLSGFLEELCSDSSENNVSQSMLESALEKHGPKLGQPDRWCAFVESGAFAQGGDEHFRDIEEFTIPAVLDCDIPEFLARQRRHESPVGLVLPIPRRLALPQDSRLPGYLSVAPDDHYDPQTGFWNTPAAQKRRLQ
jgi:CRISPR-associated endonuclease/helicase Cas3